MPFVLYHGLDHSWTPFRTLIHSAFTLQSQFAWHTRLALEHPASITSKTHDLTLSSRITKNHKEAVESIANGGSVTVVGAKGANIGVDAVQKIPIKKVLIVRPDGTQVYE